MLSSLSTSTSEKSSQSPFRVRKPVCPSQLSHHVSSSSGGVFTSEQYLFVFASTHAFTCTFVPPHSGQYNVSKNFFILNQSKKFHNEDNGFQQGTRCHNTHPYGDAYPYLHPYNLQHGKFPCIFLPVPFLL